MSEDRTDAAPARFLTRAWPWLALLALSAALHFIWFGWPATVVFDEVYFPRFGLAYLRHEYFFDLHPPLGKLVYFVFGWLAGIDPGFSFATNQLPFPDASYVLLRIPPRIAGTVLPLVLVGIALELGLSRLAAFVVGALAALDNALLVITRFALIDPFLLLFGFAALYCTLRARRGGWPWPGAAAVLAGAALSVKWTGLAFVGLVLLAEGVRWLRGRDLAGLARIGASAAIVALVYVGSFAAHFALAVRSGPDDAAMSREFQATLIGNPNAADPSLQRPGWIARFVESHQRMFENTRKTLGPHAYASRWYDWPFMMRSIDFWAEQKDGLIAHIFFLGNPVVWWATGYCILFLLVNFPPRLAGFVLQRTPARLEGAEVGIVVAYLANMLPFVPIARIMFAYHYLPALCCALIGLGYLLDRCGAYRRLLATALLVLALGGFLYFAPLSYALPLAPADFDARFWLRGWR